jgi:hypothetical protein
MPEEGNKHVAMMRIHIGTRYKYKAKPLYQRYSAAIIRTDAMAAWVERRTMHYRLCAVKAQRLAFDGCLRHHHQRVEPSCLLVSPPAAA